ncbi:MAG: glycoside hydrolase family 57 protein [Candidatus Hadarchaeota archaeon]
MTDICLAFEVHQPLRLDGNFMESAARGKGPEELFDLYFNNTWNKTIFERVANKCYRPANQILLENIERYKDQKRKFKVAFSLSGLLIRQCEMWAPDVLESFKKLAATGCAEFMCQTFYHSLSSLFSPERGEFVEQIQMHRRKIKELFGQDPKVFENTEFIYNNSIAKTIWGLGFRGMFTEGARRILEWRSPNYVYRANGSDIRVLMRNYRLADDVAFRFSNRDWPGWPLTADKYASWLSATPGQCINLFMDYETFGEHQWPETGIREFLRWLPGEVLKYENLQFSTPSELLRHGPMGEVDVHDFSTISWADVKRSTDAWLGNDMQRTAYGAVKNLEPHVKKTGDKNLLEVWRMLQASDHIYYMYTEPGAPGMVHGYFSQQFPADAFWSFMRIISNFWEKVAENLPDKDGVSARLLRVLPPDKAFHFHEDGDYIQLSAHSLEELRNSVLLASDKSVLFHLACKHFEKWVRFTVGDGELADTISKVEGKSAGDVKQKLHIIIGERIHEVGGVA